METNSEARRFVGVKLVDGVPCVFTYGYARNAKGRIEQVYSTVRNQRTISQEWTGKIYKSAREAAADSSRLNGAAVVEV